MKIDILVTGKFNVLHPGHIRLFKFAKDIGGALSVAVESDRIAGQGSHISESLRLEAVINCALVDHAFVFDEPVYELIVRLQPKVVVKGKEYEMIFNAEADAVATYGGSLVFSSGEVQFMSTELIRKEVIFSKSLTTLPRAFMARHSLTPEMLQALTTKFRDLRVLTVGDLIVDDYIECTPLGMSQEDPTLVVTPIDRRRFIGGAGVVAAHVAGLAASSHLISVVGPDEAGNFADQSLQSYGVKAFLINDTSRPTTLKERYRANSKTLLRVSHMHQSTVSRYLQSRLIEKLGDLIREIDLLILSDFNYGVLPQHVVEHAIRLANENGVIVAADSQSSSQLGDISRFKGVELILPTEREARLGTQNRDDGIVVLAEQLRQKTSAKFVLLKMGSDGVLIHAPSDSSNGWLTDRIEALNKSPVDVAGAGDSMLVVSALTLAAGGDIWCAACLGSLAAAVSVGRLGNTPLSQQDLLNLM